ncbi:NUDIX domain-containing protein [Candidatus Dojkabacteria bacterium]|nr:NUDIX domain-containing protein [Candidatus Dojkabacteria bacterium]
MKIKEELLETFDLKGNFLGNQLRDEFYEEIRKEFKDKGRITRQVKSVRIISLNSNGRILIQKRSKLKKENPGLYDKTVGGHVKAGHSWFMAVMQECYEELGFPAVVLPRQEFTNAIEVTNLESLGLFRKVDYIGNYISTRKTEKGLFKQPYLASFFIGYYDGPVQFRDGESSGIEVFSLEDLQQKIKAEPDIFTNDLQFMIEKYEKYLRPPNNNDTHS